MKQFKETTTFSGKKKTVLASSVLVVLLAALCVGLPYYVKYKISGMFKLNAQRKCEGYYLSDFEWEMLGGAYYLDNGDYRVAFQALDRIHHKLKTKEGLVKIPVFSDDKEKLEFYLSLQNPNTGAFLADDSYPLFTYIGGTANMLELVEDLSIKTNTPFHLKYRLSFFDKINTPETLREMLDDVSKVGFIGSKFKTPYVCIAELKQLVDQCTRLNLYEFSPEWIHAFYKWFYDNQDEETGMWGSRWRNDNSLVDGGSLTDSEKVIKMFVDFDGNEIHSEFPLKHRDKLFASALEKLSTPIPDDLDEVHEWLLIKDRGIRFLTRYIWHNASPKNKAALRKIAEDFVRFRFENYYVADEGAFSLYPKAKHADLDGTGEGIGMYKYLGVLSDEKQRKLWGDPNDTVVILGTHDVLTVTDNDVKSITELQDVNSVRLYEDDLDGNYLEKARAVFYPRKTRALDAVDVLSKVGLWSKSTKQNMGNWVSKESILKDVADSKVRPVPISMKIPIELANEILHKKSKLVVIGFNVLQAPRYKIVFELAEAQPSHTITESAK